MNRLHKRLAQLEKPFSDDRGESHFYLELLASWNCYPRLHDETEEQARLLMQTGPPQYERREPANDEELLSIAFLQARETGRTEAANKEAWQQERVKYYSGFDGGGLAIDTVIELYLAENAKKQDASI